MADLLYIHPRVRSPLDYVLPMGAVGLVNACEGTRLGRFQNEVRDEEIAGARVILIDCHWYPSLPAIVELVGHIRKVSPSVRIVVGGFTATVLARPLVDVLGIDYVVVGDAEGPLPQLVSRLLQGGSNPEGIPNVVHRGGQTEGRYVVTPGDYANQDFRDISWHPTMERFAAQLAHARMPTETFPWISVFKGCRLDCNFCYGNRRNQMLLRGNPFVLRPPDSVASDLRYFSAHPDRYWVHVIADFVTTLGAKYTDHVLSSRYDLGLYYEFYLLPTPEQIDRVAGAFRECVLSFSTVDQHADRPDVARTIDPARLHAAVRHACRHPNVRVIMQYDPALVSGMPSMVDLLHALRREYGVFLNRYDAWFVNAPDPGIQDNEQGAQFEESLEEARRFRFTPFRKVNWHMVRYLPRWLEILYHGRAEWNLMNLVWAVRG